MVGSYKYGIVVCIVGQGILVYVFVIIYILWFGEVDEFFGNCIFMLFDELFYFMVGVVVDRIVFVVSKVGILLRYMYYVFQMR